MCWLRVICMLFIFIAPVYTHMLSSPLFSCPLPPSLPPPSLSPSLPLSFPLSLSHLPPLPPPLPTHDIVCSCTTHTQMTAAQWYIWRRCLYSHWTNLKVSIHTVYVNSCRSQCTAHTDSLLCRNHWSWHWELYHLEFRVWKRLFWTRASFK